MGKHTLVILLGLANLALPAQSPWTRSKGAGFVQVAYHTIPRYGAVFEPSDGPGMLLDRKISENTTQIYAEYGLGDRTTLFGSLPFRLLSSGVFLAENYPTPQTAEGRLSGIGNISLGARRAIRVGEQRLTGTLRVDAPATAYDDPTGLRAGYDAWTILPMISTGRGYSKTYWYAFGGYGLRTASYSHFFQAGAEAGLNFGKLWLIAFSELLYSLENGNVDLPFNNRITNLYVDRQGWWSAGIKTIVAVTENVGITASFAGAGWAQLVPKSPGIGAGIYFKWD